MEQVSVHKASYRFVLHSANKGHECQEHNAFKVCTSHSHTGTSAAEGARTNTSAIFSSRYCSSKHYDTDVRAFEEIIILDASIRTRQFLLSCMLPYKVSRKHSKVLFVSLIVM